MTEYISFKEIQEKSAEL